MDAHRVQLKVVLIVLLINSVLTQQVRLSSDSEWSALLDLRSSLGLRARDWPRKTDPCSAWKGVECHNGRVVGLTVSGLRRTRIGSRNPRFTVDGLVNFTLLATFNSSGFSLPGSIPDWFGQSLSALQVLDLRSCSIIGPIPQSLGNLSKLNSLYLSDNFLTGIIPPTLGQLSSLSVLDLSQNLLTGSIPSALSALHNLTNLNLSSNFLSGPIPPGFGSFSNLQFLNLYNNSLTASIPLQLGNLSQLIELDLGFNYLSGSLPEDLGRLRSLQKMLIGNNGLEGPLLGNLFLNLTQLQYVVLSWNHFDGDLPEVMWLIPQLSFLDVSGNNLTGVLSNLTAPFNATRAVFNFSNNLFYGNLTSPVGKFSLTDLSGNYFQGPAPNNTGTNIVIAKNCLQSMPNQRSFEDCEKFYTERNLTFYNDRALNPTQPPLPEPAPSSKKQLTYIMVGLFGGLGLIVLLIAVLVVLLKTCNNRNANQRRTECMGPVPEGGSPTPPKVSTNLSGLGESFTFEQMLQATGDFSDKNLIKHGHSGDLFRGTLEDGFFVVIKRVDLRSFRKESSMLELDFFSKISHPRLVPLLGHCLEHENEKLLVYKYMPNGDLSNSLYRLTTLEDDNLQSLDWITRLKIAIGAAEGLSYLHHECNPPLVHRDIQASSILLDDKYEVRIGSLSEVHAQGGDNHQNAITRLLRIPQTSEQDPSGSSSVTCAYDVYCFGKVLLELVTGKLGISKSDNASTKEWLEQNLPFISIDDKELVAKIVDQSLIIDEDLLEEVWAMAVVAKSCLNPKPSRRPLMRHILRALENPLKVVREESYSSARLRTTSSRRSWSTAFFGSWHHSSLESANVPGQMNREGISGLKQLGGAGSHGSGTNELSSSHKRSSNEIFPEPTDMQDIEAR
uniref:Protein kinase domain-containing protein n=1 Tax=Davidia involucrata TaxID=16924 RepID=A0A5B6Z1D5_DAVIN